MPNISYTAEQKEMFKNRLFISERIVNLKHLEHLIKEESVYIQCLKKEMEREQIYNEKIEKIIEEILRINHKAVNFEIIVERRKTVYK